MKKNIITILGILFLMGCSLPTWETYHWDIPEEVVCPGDIKEILTRAEYQYRGDNEDNWNLPHESYFDTNYGLDCEDMAVLGAYLWDRIGADDVYVVGLTLKGYSCGHMVWRVGDKYYDSTGMHKGCEITVDKKYYDVIEWEYNNYTSLVLNNEW